jgi:hypothetical protein
LLQSVVAVAVEPFNPVPVADLAIKTITQLPLETVTPYLLAAEATVVGSSVEQMAGIHISTLMEQLEAVDQMAALAAGI